MTNIDKTICNKKTELLGYFRDRAAESLEEIRRNISASEFKAQASAIRSQAGQLAVAYQQKLGIKMMYIQDKLNEPSALDVFANAAQAIPGIALAAAWR